MSSRSTGHGHASLRFAPIAAMALACGVLAVPGAGAAQETVIIGGSGMIGVDVNLGVLETLRAAPPRAVRLLPPPAALGRAPALRLTPPPGVRGGAPALRLTPPPAGAYRPPAIGLTPPVAAAPATAAAPPPPPPAPSLTLAPPLPAISAEPAPPPAISAEPLAPPPVISAEPLAPPSPPVAVAVAPPAPPPPPAPPLAIAPPALPPPTVEKPKVPEPKVAALPPPGAAAPPGPDDLLRLEFDGDAVNLPAGAEGRLKALARRLLDSEGLRVQVQAFAGGSSGSPSVARRLSLSRALAVRAFLIEEGVRSTRIDVRALGNRTEGGPAERVDVVLVNR